MEWIKKEGTWPDMFSEALLTGILCKFLGISLAFKPIKCSNHQAYELHSGTPKLGAPFAGEPGLFRRREGAE